MAAAWLVQDVAEATQNTTSPAGAATSQAALTTEAGMRMRALTEEVTGMVATITTTTPDATGAVGTMDGPTVDGAQGSVGVGAGAVRHGMATMDIFSIRIRSMQLQRFGSRTT
jgi:hypothetical protein